MLKFYKISALVLASLATACGGGGGSPGANPNGAYTITLRADKTQLPVNIDPANNLAGIGVYAPYTTTLHVEARKDGLPIPGGEKIFGCNVSGGLSNGSLYYLDGDDEHMVEIDDGKGGTIKVPGAYRSIELGSNSGGNSFHFHAGNQAGTSTITCSVTEPSSGRLVSYSVDITVGAATGKAASIKGIAAYNTLGTQGNGNNLRTSTAISAYILDDANQPIPAAGRVNLQVSITAGGASAGARLLSASQDGSVVQVSTTGGVGTFSLASGPSEGTILLELTTDRFDNDVSNGIQDPIRQLLAMPVTAGTPAGVEAPPIEFVDIKPLAATNGLPYSYALSAKGGVAPYVWTALGGLPAGLTLSSAGVLSGTPAVTLPGTFNVAISVQDARGVSKTGNFALEVAETPVNDPATNALSIVLGGCGADVNTACPLALANPITPAPVPAPAFYYQNVLSVTGAGTGAANWTITQNPTWLTLTTNGILSTTWAAATVPTTLQDCTSGAFFISAARGGVTTMRKVQLVIGTGAGTCRSS